MSPTPTATNAASTIASEKGAVASKRCRPRRRGFFSSLFCCLVPCTSASPAHPIEVDVPKSSSAGPSTPKQEEKVAEEPASEVETKTDLLVPPSTSQAQPSENDTGTTKVTALAPIAKDEKEGADDLKTVEVEIPPPVEELEAAPPITPTLLPEEETKGVTSGAVQPPGDVGHLAAEKYSDDAESDYTVDDHDELLDAISEEERLILNGGAGIPIGPDGVPRPLLPPISPQHAGRKCLVLDLDETLVHSSFKQISHADYVVPVEIEYQWHNVYVIKRPGVDNFLKKMGEIYEVVVFTASLSKYADPVLDKLDIHQVVSHRLFRESCYNHGGNYVKDLSQLGRPIADTIILDNSPASYIFHPNNAVPVSSWFNDPHDTELTDLVPFLDDLSKVDDVRGILDGAR